MTYLDRKNPEGTYAFISYSHNDKSAVERILTALDGYGADFWYDIKLRTGQNWKEKVEEVTASKNCLGILYFLSPDFVYSTACFEEFKMYNELKKARGNFQAAYIIMDENQPETFESFINSARIKLISEHIDNFDRIAEHTSHILSNFDKDKLYLTVAKNKIDVDAFVKTVFKDVFSVWGCTSEETGKIDVLREDELIDVNYRIKTRTRIATDNTKSVSAEWKVFSFNGKTLSAVLVSDEIFGATCRSLAKNAMEDINANINVSANNEKHFKIDQDFLSCLARDENGFALRYLRSAEHEQNYMQLKEALEKVPVTDATDDGYFFVQDNQGNLLFADRGSDDVYRHIHVDAYASILPVIDIDYNKYRDYVLRNKTV